MAAQFQSLKVQTASGPKIGFRIECSECPRVDEIPSASHKSRDPSSGAARAFTNRGWRVGSNHKKHLCPDCLSKPRLVLVPKPTNQEILDQSLARVDAILDAALKPTPEPQEPAMAAIYPTNPPEKVPAAEPPKPLDLSTAFIILSKLEDVFDGKAYKANHSDLSISRDLGVPVAWVKQVRHERFGSILEEGEEIKALRAEAKAVLHRMDNIETRLNDLLRGLKSLEKDWGLVKLQADKFQERVTKIHDAVK